MFIRFKPLAQRLTIVGGAFVAAAATVLAVGALFHHAARDPWLRDTPQAREAVARCEALDGRGRQQACLRDVVAAAQRRDAGLTRLAAAPASATARAGGP